MSPLVAAVALALALTASALQPPPTARRAAGARGLTGAMTARYARAVAQPTVAVTPCGSGAGAQAFALNATTRALALADGRCLLRDAAAPGGLTAGACGGAAAIWTASPCAARGCGADDLWVRAAVDGSVAGIPGAVGPGVEMWTPDDPTGACRNELWTWDGAAGALRTQNLNAPAASCPPGPDVAGFCLTVVPPPPPPPPCMLAPRVRCHEGAWSAPPTRTPSNGVVDGPLLGNGDLGAVLAAGERGGLEWWLGKADAWATNTAAGAGAAVPELHSDTFYTAMSAGRVSLAPAAGAPRDFAARQILETARVEANASALTTSAIIASDDGALLVAFRVAVAARYNLTLGVDTSYALPLAAGASSDGAALWASKGGVATTDNAMLLMPCDTSAYVIWPSINTFTVDAVSGHIALANGTAPLQCPRRVGAAPGTLSIGACDDGEGAWRLTPAAPRGGPGALQLAMISDATICAWAEAPAYHNSGGLMAIGACAAQTSGFFTLDTDGRVRANATQCLTAVPPNVNITVGLAARVLRSADGAAVPFAAPLPARASGGAAAAATAAVDLAVGVDYLLVVTSVSTRDVGWASDPVDAALARAAAYAGAGGAVYAAARVAVHAQAWAAFWAASEVRLDPARQLLEGFWYGAQYLLACTARAGAVPPGLWGVFAVSDDNGWNGDLTLDYNAQANYYGACSSNHCELVRPHLDTVAADWHLELSRQRAAANWLVKGSAGGPGQTAQSMCCGYMDAAYEDPHICPTSAAGGYDGIELTSHIGPFSGMSYYSDLSLRVVGSMSAMPFIEYADFAGDDAYKGSTAYDFVKAVGAFLLSYATPNSTDGLTHLLNTCAQEICGGGPAREDDAHHDLAFARTVLAALLRWSEALGRDAALRPRWAALRDALPPYPAGVAADGAGVWLEAADTQAFWLSNANGYPIVYTAALHPASDVSLSSPAPDVARGCATVLAIANVSHWRPLNGLCMAWPPAARCAGRERAAAVFDGWEAALAAVMNHNFYPDLDGGGIEQAGATEAVNSALLQSQEGFIRLFAMVPLGEVAAFSTLRARGGFLVSAAWAGGVAAPVAIASDATVVRNCSFLSPWWPESAAPPRVADAATNATVPSWPDVGAAVPGVFAFTAPPGAAFLLWPS